MLSYPAVTAESALSTLLLLMRCSFAQYLRYAHPFVRRNHTEAINVLDDIVADQTLMADRAEAAIESMGRVPPNVDFPLEFTDSHDLAIEYLVARAIKHQEQDLETLGRLSASLTHHASIRSMAEEAKGMAQAHLESLQECRVSG